MMKPDPLHVCIMGHSGVGKSPLSKLFPLPGWDPFRVRKPRDENDKAMTEDDFAALLVKGQVKIKDKTWERGELVFPSAPEGADPTDGEVIRLTYEKHRLCVCAGWSFFKVRDADQCLCHKDFDPDLSMRIEVFAPVLLTMVRERKRLPPVCRLNPDSLLVILLNPTSLPFERMEEPLTELRLATALAVTERCRVKGEIPDLADAFRRAEHLQAELAAWRGFLNDPNVSTLECREWPHFEFRYHSSEAAERERARNSVFRALWDHPKWTKEQKVNWAGKLQLSCMM